MTLDEIKHAISIKTRDLEAAKKARRIALIAGDAAKADDAKARVAQYESDLADLVETEAALREADQAGTVEMERAAHRSAFTEAKALAEKHLEFATAAQEHATGLAAALVGVESNRRAVREALRRAGRVSEIEGGLLSVEGVCNIVAKVMLDAGAKSCSSLDLAPVCMIPDETVVTQAGRNVARIIAQIDLRARKLNGEEV